MKPELPPTDPAEMTQFIESRYHAVHRRQLAELVPLAEKVQTVHYGDEHVPLGLVDVLDRLCEDMEAHMQKEEVILFPAIRQGGMPGIEQPIAVMRAEHDDHGREIAEIRRLTQDLTLPEDACRSWAALYAGLAALLADLEEHIQLENDVLFPQFEPSGVAHG